MSKRLELFNVCGVAAILLSLNLAMASPSEPASGIELETFCYSTGAGLEDPGAKYSWNVPPKLNLELDKPVLVTCNTGWLQAKGIVGVQITYIGKSSREYELKFEPVSTRTEDKSKDADGSIIVRTKIGKIPFKETKEKDIQFASYQIDTNYGKYYSQHCVFRSIAE